MPGYISGWAIHRMRKAKVLLVSHAAEARCEARGGTGRLVANAF
jgi:hypothetical protein